jgi:hypothetical protein
MKREILSLDNEGRRLTKVAIDHPATMDLRSTILQALSCLDHDIELSCSACFDLNRFVQLHRNGSPDGSLDDCVRGLNWLRLRLSAQDAVRRTSVVRWVRYIREHSTDIRLLELGDALDAGLRASATGERLDGRDRDALVGWLTEPGVERDMAYEEAVQQILKQPSSPGVVHLQLEPIGTPGKMCHARCDAMIDDPPSQLAVDVMFVTCPHCRKMDFMTEVNVNALRQALSGGSNGK